MIQQEKNIKNIYRILDDKFTNFNKKEWNIFEMRYNKNILIFK